MKFKRTFAKTVMANKKYLHIHIHSHPHISLAHNFNMLALEMFHWGGDQYKKF